MATSRSGKNRDAFLAGWVNFWKQRDPRRLVTSGSAYPQLPENQFHVYAGGRGPHGWLGKDYLKDVQAFTVPVIVHEMGQWCVYPNFDEVRKYTGPLKPKNFDIFRDSLAEHGMLDQWPDFLRASGKLQVLCYKEEIEAALRTPGIGGFELLDLHDFPGQGTALVGVLDPFWESKGYVTPAQYRRFCNSTVPLARVLKRVWTADETFSAEVEVAHFGPAPLENAVAAWKLVSADGQTLAKGEFPPKTIPLGQSTPLGRITIDCQLCQLSTTAPTACKLVVRLKGTPFENDWNLWIYPAQVGTRGPGRRAGHPCPGPGRPRPAWPPAAGCCCSRPGSRACTRASTSSLSFGTATCSIPRPARPSACSAIPSIPLWPIPHSILPGLAMG